MSNIRSSNIRFHLDSELQRRAWEYLRTTARSRHMSYGALISEAVTDYAARQEKSRDDPYFESREKEDRFIGQIIEEVRLALEKSLPVFLAGYRAGMTGTPAPVITEAPEQTDDADIDWSFAGG